jgi:DNA (cytosine-5)-methyltransferase 3A
VIKLLIGGSPCTFWSIAQKNNRETEAEGLGWELFKNYLIAKEKFKPDFFLYENNKSAAQPIKDQISRELGVDLMYINSALVSAQNRQRFYAFNWEVEHPEDRGILLRDILVSGSDLNGTLKNSQGMRLYSIDGKSVNMTAQGGGLGAKSGLYAIPVGTTKDEKGYCVSANYANGSGEKIGNYVAHTLTKGCKSMVAEALPCLAAPVEWDENGKPTKAISGADGKTYIVYEVCNGLITIKGKQYPIKLSDGSYIIRKLTPVECERLQTLPDGYTRAVSDAQRYKGLGNGWTAEVIIHILNGALKDVPRDEEIIVLSMYDGIGTGRYCLDKMGFTNIRYYAYEIDKFAKQVAMSNYPDIIQMGDAFDLRHPDWTIGY